MNLLKLELKKNNIRPYLVTSIFILIALLGLTYIFAYVPELDTADKNAVEIFSSYKGIYSMSIAVGLIVYSALSSAMGYQYVIKEYIGKNAIMLFTYPINKKAIMWTKIKTLLLFICGIVFLSVIINFIVFAITGSLFSLVNDSVQIIDLFIVVRNTFVLICLVSGITLCAIRLGFIKKSNSITIISAIFFSMLLVNLIVTMNNNFMVVFLLSIFILLTGIILSFNMAHKINEMEV